MSASTSPSTSFTSSPSSSSPSSAATAITAAISCPFNHPLIEESVYHHTIQQHTRQMILSLIQQEVRYIFLSILSYIPHIYDYAYICIFTILCRYIEYVSSVSIYCLTATLRIFR